MSDWVSVKDRLPDIEPVIMCNAEHRIVTVGPNRGAFVTPTTMARRTGPNEWAMVEATHWFPIPPLPSLRACVECHASLETTDKRLRYCSSACAALAQKRFKRAWWRENGKEWRKGREK